jgi:hypothetical protein
MAQKLSKDHPKRAGSKINFSGVDGRDVYNITAPFKTTFNGVQEEVIAGRVEERDSENSNVIFFTKVSDSEIEYWKPLKNAPVFNLQDPFFSKIGDDLVVGGVNLIEKDGQITSYYTSFYRGKSLDSLKHLTDGPKGMKDIRLVELEKGRIGVFTRPQGKIGGKGKIGYTEISDLGELNSTLIDQAPLIEQLEAQFGKDVWGGVNAAYPLKNSKIGVLGHIAYWSHEGTKIYQRHYHSITFVFNPVTRKVSDIKIIATRNLLPPGASKRADLVDVIFSGGINIENNQYYLYGGAGDAESFKLHIDNPF